MKRLQLGNWNIEVDIEKTREFYEQAALITDRCECNNCRNYVSACEYYSEEVKIFFSEIGIIPTKEAEVYEFYEKSDGLHLYGGFYHIVGKIISGNDCWESKDNGVYIEKLVDIDSSFKYGFTYDLSLVPTNFPGPVIQLEFEASIPWVIN